MQDLDKKEKESYRYRLNRRNKKFLFRGKETLPCCYCNKILTFQNSTLEHMLDRSKGGTDDLSNLAISCYPCNNKKRNRSFEEWKRIRKNKEVKRMGHAMFTIWKRSLHGTGFSYFETI